MISESDATILTGRGVEEARRKMAEAFQRIRQHPAQQPTPKAQVEYDEHQETHFRERAHKLTQAALMGVGKSRCRPKQQVI